MTMITPGQANARHIFNNLEGTWRFARTLSDHAAEMFFTASGEAVFEKMEGENDQLFYRENGVLNLCGNRKEIAFRRNYIFRLVDEMIQIFFDDGISKRKLYQTLLPQNEEGLYVGTEHHCVEDTYHGQYVFQKEDEFSIVYMVYGPKKNLEIKSIFKKQGVKK